MAENSQIYNEIRLLLIAILKQSRADIDKRLKKSGVSTMQFGTLKLIQHGDEQGSTISELSKQMMIEPATLVPVIDLLEAKGLVQRGVDPKDRRRTPIQLTAKGRKVASSMSGIDADNSFSQALKKMGETKMRLLKENLEELAGGMNGGKKALETLRKVFK